jgi:sigma-B regulation protein RsbU (phosphoserine phosphatase)
LLLFSDGILEHIKAGTLEEKEARLAAAVAESEGDFEKLRAILKLSKSIKVPDDIAVLSVSGA